MWPLSHCRQMKIRSMMRLSILKSTKVSYCLLFFGDSFLFGVFRSDFDEFKTIFGVGRKPHEKK
jgi:hypothetical protein